MKSLAIIGLLSAAATAGTLRGTVIDRTTKQPMGGAIVEVGDQLLATDDAGGFALALPDGTYRVTVSGVTREVKLRGDFTIVFEIQGEQIEVHAIAPSASGEITVDAAFARSVPGGGDAAKIVQSLPAVARPAAGSTEIVVWGAAPNETRIFVAGVPVPSLFHLGGYRAAIGNELIGDVHLAPAAFGTDRGQAIGGVIDIGLLDPAKAPQLRAQLDVLDASLVGRTTLGDATIAAAVRQSWLDHVIGFIEDPHTLAPNAPLPRWTDAQVVARWPVREDLTLSAFALGSIDTLDRTLTST
ncbi:MAG TPA: hypothetical protein VGC41_16850, partial [Kofleriaceae bacterium]